MHARIVTVQLQPGKIDEAIRIFRDSIVPAAKQQNGFKGALLLTDASADKVISVTQWETEADMLASETSGYYQEQVAKVGHIVRSQPTDEHYQVSVQV